MKLKSYILNRFAEKNDHYRSWIFDSPSEYQVVNDFLPNWEIPSDAGIVITHIHYRWEEISALRRIYETTKVPILILADGVLEYRNTWENPTLSDGAIFQPMIGHKLACIGRAQSRIIESWGNEGKCEIVGLPLFDDRYSEEHLPVQADGPFRLLIATANTPAFTPAQWDQTANSLRDLKTKFDKCPFINQRPLEITWRLTGDLDKRIGVVNSSDSEKETRSLSDEIELADAVITTPSTVYLESVLKRRPTAVLDFTNSPAYVPSAWTISAPAHINSVLNELENPPAAKMQFQRTVLFDQVELGTDSRNRLHTLIESMIKAGQEARRSGHSIHLPTHVLPHSALPIHEEVKDFDPISLYPKNEIFKMNDLSMIKQELNQAIGRMHQLPKDLIQKDNDILAMNQHIQALVENQETGLQQKKEDIAKKNAHIMSLTNMIEEAYQNVAKLRAQLAQQHSQVSEQNKLIAKQNSKVVRQDARIAKQEAQITSLATRSTKANQTLAQIGNQLHQHWTQQEETGATKSQSGKPATTKLKVVKNTKRDAA